MSLPYIKCPKCNELSSSKDYWTCPSCDYEETRKSILLEENKDYSEQRNKNWDNRDEELRKWIGEQKDLTEEMINICLPKNKYNWKVNYPASLGRYVAGETEYHENELLEAQKFIKWHNLVIYPYYADSDPTKLRFPKSLLTYEGSYNFDGEGYFPTVPHEVAHASPKVKRDPKFQPFVNKYSPGPGHDDVWLNKNKEFYNKLISLGYKEKVKERFKKLEEIKKIN